MSLAGGLTVLKGPGYFYNGTTYNIITGNVVTGAFTTVTLPESTTLLSFTMLQTSEAVQIEALAKSFTTMASNPVELRVAEYLDAIQYTASGDMLNILSHLQNLEASQFGQAFSSMSPASYDHYTTDELQQHQALHGVIAEADEHGALLRKR